MYMLGRTKDKCSFFFLFFLIMMYQVEVSCTYVYVCVHRGKSRCVHESSERLRRWWLLMLILLNDYLLSLFFLCFPLLSLRSSKDFYKPVEDCLKSMYDHSVVSFVSLLSLLISSSSSSSFLPPLLLFRSLQTIEAA